MHRKEFGSSRLCEFLTEHTKSPYRCIQTNAEHTVDSQFRCVFLWFVGNLWYFFFGPTRSFYSIWFGCGGFWFYAQPVCTRTHRPNEYMLCADGHEFRSSFSLIYFSIDGSKDLHFTIWLGIAWLERTLPTKTKRKVFLVKISQAHIVFSFYVDTFCMRLHDVQKPKRRSLEFISFEVNFMITALAIVHLILCISFARCNLRGILLVCFIDENDFLVEPTCAERTISSKGNELLGCTYVFQCVSRILKQFNKTNWRLFTCY